MLVERMRESQKREELMAGITWEQEPKEMTDGEMFEFMSGFAKRNEGLPH